MAVSKVELGGETLIDISGDTVTPETLAEGATAHNSAGEPIKGTMKNLSEVDASKVIFDQEVTTGYAVGNIKLTNGKGILAEKGATLLQVMKNIWEKANPPTVVQPSVTISFHSTGSFTEGKCPTKGGSYEAGTKFDGVLFKATFNKGSYEFDDDNGVEFEVRNDRGFYFSDGLGNYTSSEDNPSPINPTGYHVFPKLTVTENTNYVITGTANHTQGIVPRGSLEGSLFPELRITSTSTKGYSSAIKGYRNTFYGVLTSKEVLTNDNIREICWRNGMNQSNAKWSNGKTFTIDIPKSENGVNIYRVLIAYPATLQDLTEVIDKNDSNANIVSGFTLVKDANGNLLKIGGYDNYGPIEYKVYIQDFANPYDTANTYTVKI